MKHFAIAIDGPCGAGKTTTAKLVADSLNTDTMPFVYVDTGAMYRAFAVHKLWMEKESEEPVSNEAALRTFDLDIQNKDGNQKTLIFGQDITHYLRTEEVSMMASTCSADPAVRAALLELQRRQVLVHNIVMEGRDIGTVILPDADLKIFLTAMPEVRAFRRYKDLLVAGNNPRYDTILADLIKRDKQDTSRAECPLHQAADAILLDNSDLSINETVNQILELAAQRI